MEIFRSASKPTRPADNTTFVGPSRMQQLAVSSEGLPVHVYRVEFGPGGRTNWHVHSGPQWLFVLQGRIRVQKWGEAVQEVERGDAVLIGPNEKHWHGGAPAAGGIHLAVNINFKTDWLEPVNDQQYEADAAAILR
jgi:quercetin dioxygenase-like cupin family protein